jgi:phospholipase/lecithinase/hemolysin
MPIRRLIAAVVACAALPHFAAAEPIAAVVVFGDSLSDSGNVFNATGGRFPPGPYSFGRLSRRPYPFDREVCCTLTHPTKPASRR